MRIAHLIIAHKNPAQVERLINALTHENFDFYIHFNKNMDEKEYGYLAQLPRVRFIQNRILVRWASYRFTEAILEGMREILASGQQYDFINLLSGQDYPIKPVAAIYDFFARHVGSSFLSYEREGSRWWSHAITRFERYHTTNFQFRGQYRLEALINKVLPKRAFPLPYTLYGGPDGSWWTISTDCAAYLVNFLDARPNLRWFSSFTWCPDEFLLATILLNSPHKRRVINNNYRYIDWSAGGPNPKLLTIEDAPKLAQTSKLFARKFDLDLAPEILDVLDQTVLLSPTATAP